ncbi:MAG: hypothetical protein SGJ18_06625 [Pseudomonadota bacterium]|nr:hypothetical protein [Pseudomonadota bacterium]
MKVSNLYNVLVLGGMMVAGKGVLAQELAVPFTASEPELQQLICQPKNPETCVMDESGKMKPIEGFFCCWGTSCEENPS